MALDVGEPEVIPLDSFRVTQSEQGTHRKKEETPFGRQLREQKEYTDLAHGGSRRNEKLRQYLENDRKVLFFKCYWDDPTRYGTRNYYSLNYYLADDSVELLENLPRNSGRYPYPTFWRRAPLRKNPYVSP